LLNHVVVFVYTLETVSDLGLDYYGIW